MITTQLKQQALVAMLDGGFTQANALEILNGPGGHAFKVRELRDEFAAAALQGFIACHTGAVTCPPRPDNAAVQAYEYADAMMKARNA